MGGRGEVVVPYCDEPVGAKEHQGVGEGGVFSDEELKGEEAVVVRVEGPCKPVNGGRCATKERTWMNVRRGNARVYSTYLR